MVNEPRFQYIQTNGVTLRTVVKGEGPLVILLHGFPEFWHLWRHQIDPIVEAGYKVAVPDQRGYGGSDAPEAIEDYDILHLSGDVVGLAGALGYEKFIVIGQDWGCIVAWHTALLYPDRVSAVMGLSVPYWGRPEAPDTLINPRGLEDKFWYIREFQKTGAELGLQANTEATLRMTYHVISADSQPGTWMSQTNFPAGTSMRDMFGVPAELPAWLGREDLDYHIAQFQKNGFRGGVNWYRNLERNWILTPQLANAKFTQPAHFVAGAEDDVLLYVPSWEELMSAHFEDLRRIKLIEGAGHWLMLEKPQETTDEILLFLESVAGS
ncbi:MAG: alpha/beta hydrolase [Porticoccaceae bacterium]